MINTYFLVLLIWSISGLYRRRVFLSVIFTLYVLVYLAIDVVSADGLNLAALYHLDTNITGSSIGGYVLYFITVILGVVLACVCGLLVSRKVSSKLNGKVFAVSCLAAFILSQPTLDGAKLVQDFYAVSNMPDPVDMYVDQRDLKIQPQKDVVIISVESLNNSIWKKFSRMAPDVTGVSFDEVKQLPGTGWTVAGLTAANCGLPLGLGTGNNRQPYIYPSHTCLTDILSNSGYRVVAVQGTDGRFANLEKLYLGHSVKPGNFIDKRKIQSSEQPSSWAGSYHDREVINVARKRLNSHVETDGNTPIALYVNTIDTHAPEGYPTVACRSHYSTVEDTLEQSYRCTIDNIINFIRYLQSTKREMIVVVHSDHLLMMNETHLTGKQELEKNTFVVFDVNSDDKSKGIINNLHSGSTLDIAPTILDMLSDGRVTRLGFGYSLMHRPSFDLVWRDYIPYQYADFLKKKQNFPKLKTILPVASDDVLIVNGGIEVSLPFAYLSSSEEFVFSDGNENGRAHSNSLSRIVKNIGDKEGIIFAACSSIDGYEVESGACALSKTDEGIVAAVQLNSKTTLEVMRSKLELQRNLLEIVALSKKSFWDYFAVSSYNTMRTYLSTEYTQSLKNAYVRFGFYAYQLTNGAEFDASRAQDDIAHAGGSIDGLLYTNSLEAVQKSLEMGINKIELDLQISSDGHIVAAHDWPSWSKMTGCSSVKVPTLEEFRRCKLHGKYTPIDADVINKLMDQHENLILVTDKLNAPLKVKKQIRHRSRVMMELFTEGAIREANKLKIKVLVSGELLKSDYSLSLERPPWFDQMKIAGVTADRQMIMRFPQEFHSLKMQGKRIYAFSVNDGNYRGRETEVWCDLRGLITGMYVDFPLSYEKVNC